MQTRQCRSLAACAGLLLVTSAGVGMAQPSNSEARTIAGVWFVEVTPRSCETGAQVAPVVRSMVTFHADGTLSESPATPAMAPGQRVPGQGVWRHDGGHTYHQHFAALIAFTTPPGAMSPGFEAGWQEVTHTAELVAPNALESAGTNAFYRTDGTLYRSGCSTASGRRVE